MQTKHYGPDKKVVSARPSQFIILSLGSPFASLLMLQLQLCLTPYADANRAFAPEFWWLLARKNSVLATNPFPLAA